MRRFGLSVWCGLAVVCIGGSLLAAQSELEALAERAGVQYAKVPRKVLAFYYPWYGNPGVAGGSGRWSHWSDVDQTAKQIKSSTQYPTLGPYDSHDPQTIAQHCTWAKQAGVDGFIVSWWGRDSFSDQAMKPILEACRQAGLEVTVYYETVPRPRNAEAAAEDVLHLLEQYAEHPAWLRVDDKPVVFVYGRAVEEIGLMGWLRAVSMVNRKYARKAVFMGDQMSRSAARVFDGIHTYNTAGVLANKDLAEVGRWAKSTYPGWVEAADAFSRISTLTVIPGYDDTKIRKPGLRVERFEGASYRRQWEEAISADPHWILVTSWNEWHEGSEIEPSAEYGEQYLKMTGEMAARFKGKGPRVRPERPQQDSGMPEREKSRQLAKLRGVKIALMPDPAFKVIWPLLHLSPPPTSVSWEEIADWARSGAEESPVLIYAAGETYRQTVRQPGDVDDGLLRYLESGGFLVVLPSGPMPFHYAEERKGVNSSEKFGLPLSVAGPDGGWEEPPKDTNLQFVQVGNRLPHVPAVFPFPESGDLRWRPLVRSRLAEGDRFVPLVELRDDRRNHYGDAVAYVEHRASEPKNGRILYVWFELLNTTHGEALLYDVLGLVGEMVQDQ